MFVKDVAGREIVNLSLAFRIGLRHHWRDDLWQVYAEYGFEKHVILFESEAREEGEAHLALIERLLRDRDSFLY